MYKQTSVRISFLIYSIATKKKFTTFAATSANTCWKSILFLSWGHLTYAWLFILWRRLSISLPWFPGETCLRKGLYLLDLPHLLACLVRYNILPIDMMLWLPALQREVSVIIVKFFEDVEVIAASTSGTSVKYGKLKIDSLGLRVSVRRIIDMTWITCDITYVTWRHVAKVTRSVRRSKSGSSTFQIEDSETISTLPMMLWCGYFGEI